jgi:formylglycine-generating enzyme required for sulfatase activity
VEQVSWEDAVEYCDRLSRHTQKQYQLPTEAQWEYACRAGTTTPFHFGETITTAVANYCGVDDKERDWSGSYGDGPKGEYREQTTAVDYFEIANAFGLCDMHGNVWEWCADHWHDSYEGAPKDGTAWLIDDEEINREASNLDREKGEKEEKKELKRILRGGSWNLNPGVCRAATRFNYPPVYRNYIVGFRVCCAAPRALP